MYVCGWCARDLKSKDCVKLEKLMLTHSDVVPNCGSDTCLAQNSGDAGGWRARRPIGIRKPNQRKRKNPEQPPKSNKKKKESVEILDSD